MNHVIENINKRHSVRLFEQKPVPNDIITQVIEAGNLAPSTGDTKDVEVVVNEKSAQNQNGFSPHLWLNNKWLLCFR